MTGFTFLSRLTQIAPPCTRFVFLGAGFRLGLPSHPASRRRSCLRLGVSTTSSSRGLSPPSDRPCRAYSRAAPAAPLARRQRRALPWRGPPGARPAAQPRGTQIEAAHTVAQIGKARCRLLGPRLSSSQPPRLRRSLRSRRMRSATPTLDPVSARTDLAAAKRAEQSRTTGAQQRACGPS